MSTDLWEAASAAIQTLKNIGYARACFVGSVASSLYGNSRYPKDLDILILETSDDQEYIKRRIVNSNPSFFLVPSKKPLATYKILYYRPSSTRSSYSSSYYDNSSYASSSYSSYTNTRTSIKVDILLPGIMSIPRISSSLIDTTNSRRLPAAPLSLTLLLKLQAWSQHRAAIEYHFSKEQYKDSSDLDQLVPIAERKGLKIRRDGLELPIEFVNEAQARVKEYLQAHPNSPTRSGWVSMGFKVPENSPTTSAYSGRSIHTTTYRSSNTSTSTSTASSTARKYNVKPTPRVKPLYSYRGSRYDFD
ncbi:hypothetical protein CPB86DRAFT_790831 [Serendipita vermifera]|nr:hypothetical protein CPB86DRAFT_790831 [Serendipita vermifera]